MRVILGEQEVEDLIFLLRQLKKNDDVKKWIKNLRSRRRDTKKSQAYEEAAQGYAHEGQLEIDSGATVSMGSDDGAYVQAWQWVDGSEMREILQQERNRKKCVAQLSTPVTSSDPKTQAK